MTGFGRASSIFFNKKVTVEIRSLNSKGTDVYLKIPSSYKAYELPIRKFITDSLQRGKIECTITEEIIKGEQKVSINTELLQAYYEELTKISDNVGAHPSDLFSTILRFPDIIQTSDEDLSEEEWSQIEQLMKVVIQNTNDFRTTEGKTLVADFTICINNIKKLLAEVPKYENLRIDSIKERMTKGLEKISETVDQNRFEQELIYYIEKLDINEEKIRLQHHLDYFLETMESNDIVGKKLGFISQEIGREINTLGSKSYHAELQKIVVEMKDSLEKIKEQVSNTL